MEFVQEAQDPILPSIAENSMPETAEPATLDINEMTTTPSSTRTNLKFNPPAEFDGSYKNFRTFLRDLTIFLDGNEVTSDTKKILIALSYMRQGAASEFVQEEANAAMANDPPDWGTWSTFITRLKARFLPKNLARDARDQLEQYQQGKKLIDEYITQLEILFNDAGLTDDAEKICILERGVDLSILDTIYSSDSPIPSDYSSYRAKVLAIGRMHEQRRNIQRIGTSSSSSVPTTKRPFNFVTHVHPPSEKKTGTGVTYAGAGQSMEVDRSKQPLRCFGCGQIGHLRNNCPSGKVKMNMRAILENFDEEELDELRGELILNSKDEDFAEGR